MSINTTMDLPVLIIREALVFPDNSLPVAVGRKISVQAIKDSRENFDSLVFVTNQIDADKDNLEIGDIFDYGTLCNVTSYRDKGKVISTVVKGNVRVKLSNIRFVNGAFYATGEPLAYDFIEKNVLDSYLKATQDLIKKCNSKEIYDKFGSGKPETDFITLANKLFQALPSSPDFQRSCLKENDPKELMKYINQLFKIQKIQVDLEQNINNTIRESSEQAQKDYFLRERLKAIKKEIANNDPSAESEDNFQKKLDSGNYPENIKAKVQKEISKMNMMPPGSLEVSLIQNYVDVVLSTPWWQTTEDKEDIKNVEKILNEDHYGLQKPKERILEYLAVKKLTGNLKAPILCFFGPPGCGKTSLGRSIARALGRKFIKASLGGVSDEAEIRGHRRTYVGSMPGRIISGMRKAGVINPVFLLDEVDKLGSSYKGDPANALLEVLDPEQNFAFNDNYLEEPYDLSKVLFICTANSLDDIPGPLRDRLELIEVNSYTSLEKLQIAKEHLVKIEIEANGLKEDKVSFTDEAIMYIIEHYTREAGVRSLQRAIASCIRKTAVHFVKHPRAKAVEITSEKVKEYLGIEIFENTKKEKAKQIGVVTGLAYTQYGGDILPIEVTHFKGKGGLVLTGNLGDVMKESATIALSYVKANAKKYGIDESVFNDDVHIHVPEGAIPKDGPSAGVALSIAIISCLSKTPVDPNVAMTGEVTLRGNALPIGGLREKSLAALRAGIKRIIVPRENSKNVDELPKEVKEGLEIVFMDSVEDAARVALLKE